MYFYNLYIRLLNVFVLFFAPYVKDLLDINYINPNKKLTDIERIRADNYKNEHYRLYSKKTVSVKEPLYKIIKYKIELFMYVSYFYIFTKLIKLFEPIIRDINDIISINTSIFTKNGEIDYNEYYNKFIVSKKNEKKITIDTSEIKLYDLYILYKQYILNILYNFYIFILIRSSNIISVLITDIKFILNLKEDIPNISESFEETTALQEEFIKNSEEFLSIINSSNQKSNEKKLL